MISFGVRLAFVDDGAVFGLSFWEIAIILMVALIILGPKKLPELAKSLGKGIREFRKATDDFKSTMDYEMNKPEEPRKQIPPPVEDAEIMPAAPTEPAEDVAKAAKAEEDAKKAVEAAQAKASDSEPPASEAEAPPVESDTSKTTTAQS